MVSKTDQSFRWRSIYWKAQFIPAFTRLLWHFRWHTTAAMRWVVQRRTFCLACCFVCFKYQTELYFEGKASTLPSLSHQFLTPEHTPCWAGTQIEKTSGADVGSAEVNGCCSVTSCQILITWVHTDAVQQVFYFCLLFISISFGSHIFKHTLK